MLSIIIPVLNEEKTIGSVIENVKSSISGDNYEIIVVDGGSNDNTVSIAKSSCDQLITSSAGRGVQLNYGARASQGDTLLFVHADTILPVEFDKMITNAISTSGKSWGRFDIKLSGKKYIFRIVESLVNLRSRITSISTGDQCLFMTRALFENVNGYKDIPLMEDIDISKRLKKISIPVCLPHKVITSSRRWEEKGIIRTILLMWWLRFMFFAGVSPDNLKRLYQ